MIRRFAHLDYDGRQGNSQRQQSRHQPTGSLKRYRGSGQSDKDPAPEEFEWTRHPHDIAEQEKMAEHKGKDYTPPPDDHRQYDCARDANDEDESIDDR